MRLKRNLCVLILALSIIAGGAWITGMISADAKAWSSAEQYQQTYRNNHSTAEWTYKAFH